MEKAHIQEKKMWVKHDHISFDHDEIFHLNFMT